MTKGAKLFLHWWVTAYAGFIGVRLFQGLELDSKALIGGLVLQFVLVTLCAVIIAVGKRLFFRLR